MLKRMADPSEEAFLSSLHHNWRTADPNQGSDRLSMLELSAEPLTPLGQDGQTKTGAKAIQHERLIPVTQDCSPRGWIAACSRLGELLRYRDQMPDRPLSTWNADGASKDRRLFAKSDHEPVQFRPAGVESRFLRDGRCDRCDLLIVTDHRQQMAFRAPALRIVFGDHAIHSDRYVDRRVSKNLRELQVPESKMCVFHERLLLSSRIAVVPSA
jgi:hypothetical protein